ncbi:cell division protein FtsA [Candidatus Woesebacteria bacterium RBG_19FT_COMBO_47_8]|uniref:Cell division protein FtsA n=1 Tax=Candidatus Woesebacteria bacterium RBG_13_46_13 TaxID=1802479 RepID=A0A1F7X3T1_9BACT|nr:MAG: cell division protein FtsA [Candidatus Woesebacteria bacterium RBG_13_46_13]OGM18186.1 MAG: cell division protein FtsA [Candidatus Woesebacteria bacterium RBG_19FT_COMBO_47_8]HJX58939.1 cell division protein FtsA [Patescibacteria group bacterium]
MTKSRIIAGIELGSSKIATVVAQVQVNPTTLETSVNIAGVAASESKGIRKGQIVDIEEAVESTIASVEAAERMAGYHLESAFVALGGAHLHSQNSHGVVAVSDPDGEISADDVDRVVQAASAISLPQSREIIHVLPREFIVDGEAGVKDAIGMSGVRLEVETHIITASTAAIKNFKKALNEVGVEIEDLVFSGLAGAYSSLSSTEKELGCALVDIGGGTTSIAAYVDGALTHSSVIPVGARNVTNDLAIGLRVSLESAERIKIALSQEAQKSKLKTEEEADQFDLADLGVSEAKKVSKKTLVEGIVRPRLNEIFTMVRIELEKASIINRIPSGVVITGGGAETVGTVDSAKRMLSLPVRLGKPKGVGGLIDDIINPSFSVPVGLILFGAGQEPAEKFGSFGGRFKFPSMGIAGKLVDMVKNLLP